MAIDIIDAWAQHPTRRHIDDPIFDSLRIWTRTESEVPATDIPVSMTIHAMDEAGVSKALISAWYGPVILRIKPDTHFLS